MMKESISEYQVVVTTCASAGHDLLQGVRFPRVLVDECTQSVEPSTLIPLSMGCSHLVLIGDHRQLPPTVITEEAKRGGLEKSLFARLAKDDVAMEKAFAPLGSLSLGSTTEGPHNIVAPVLLDAQRRMHPSIATFPNQHFYRGLIRDMVPERPSILGVPWPQQGESRVLLVDVAPSEGEQRAGTSLYNTEEVDAVIDLAECVLLNQGGQANPQDGDGRGLIPEEVSVITPYVQQRHALQASLA